MKATSLLAGATAIAAVPASAFPFLGGLLGQGTGGGNLNLLSGDSKNELQGMIKTFNGYNPGQVSQLTAAIKDGMQQVGGADTTPNAPGSIMGKNYKSVTKDDIYNAWGLGRSDTPTNGSAVNPAPGTPLHKRMAERSLLWGGVAEDENHPYIPPGPNDLRGPCPGLNTAANHGYLPRSGVVKPAELFVGTFQGLSLAPDMCALLATLAFLFKGDMGTMTLSIGTQHGNGKGIADHGVLEGDASVTRQDAHFGNPWVVQPHLVEQFKGECNTYGGGDVTVQSLANSRYRAWKYSRDNNPKFDFNPWRMIVAYAESGFTHEALRGDSKVFTNDMIDSWFIKERYPDGWRRRQVPVTIAEMLAWGAVINAAKPTKPGWSLGMKGFYLPVPNMNGLYGFFGSLTGGGGGSKGSLSGVGCSLCGSFLGWFPSSLGGVFNDIGIGGLSGYGC